MRLKGENVMGVKAGGYMMAVIELKCIVSLISLTALICWFIASSWGSQVPYHPKPVEVVSLFFAKHKMVRDKGKFRSKICAFLSASQVTARQPGQRRPGPRPL